MPEFQLVSPFPPAGDQPAAIEQLVKGVRENRPHQTLLGVTGSGKTFTMANVIQNRSKSRPALVLSHNKTLAAQLYSEFKRVLPATTRSTTSSAITTTTSPKPTSRSAISTSRKTPRSTRISTACGWPRPAALVSRQRCDRGGQRLPASMAWARREDYRDMMVGREAVGETSSTGMKPSSSSSISSTTATTCRLQARHLPRGGGTSIELWPAYEEFGVPHRACGGTRSSTLSIINPDLSGEVIERKPGIVQSIRPSTSSCPSRVLKARSRRSSRNWRNASRR